MATKTNRHIPWEDLRLVLEIQQAGTLSGAARRLGVSHATVFRRLGGLEGRLGVALFERGRDGYAATPSGEDVADVARHVASQVHDLERRVTGRDLQPSGVVRVTTTDTLLWGLLSPLFAEFRAAFPDITLEVAVSNSVLNLTHREADVAIRPCQSPPQTLVGRRVGRIAQAVYGNAEAVARGMAAAQWIGPDEAMGYAALADWMSLHGLDVRCRMRVDTVLGMAAAARDGAGLAVLPCYLGDAEPALRRLDAPVEELATDLWVLTHPDLRRTARVRALTGFLGEFLVAKRPALAGHGPIA